MNTFQISQERDREDLLIQQVLAGDRRAFEQLCEPYERKLLNRALSIVGSAEDAKDILQESMLKCYQALASFRAEARFETWLTQIVVNQARMCLRVQTRKRCVQLLPVMEEMFVSKERNGYETLAMKQRIEALRCGIADLPAVYREVIELRLRELKNRESKESLEISLPALKSRQFRAIHQLRHRLTQRLK
jgi:RNA polymerase sigma-70 factor (ECF subfamily)